MIKNKEQRILNFLKKNRGPVATSKIANEIKSNFWMAKQYLEILERTNEIRRIDQINSTYWELER